MANKTYCVEFDDLCDNVAEDAYEQLSLLHDKYPQVKVTLFTIPQRTSDETIHKFKSLPWIKLAPHGWRHTRGECLGWSKEEAIDKIMLANERGIDAPTFRAPAWLIDRDIYAACSELGYAVADHKDFRLNYTDVQVYTYNNFLGKKPKVRGIHGHLTSVCDNYIGDMLTDGRLTFSDKATFMWPWEVAVENPLMAPDEEEQE